LIGGFYLCWVLSLLGFISVGFYLCMGFISAYVFICWAFSLWAFSVWAFICKAFLSAGRGTLFEWRSLSVNFGAEDFYLDFLRARLLRF
jgi:hypothetical protein